MYGTGTRIGFGMGKDDVVQMYAELEISMV
jgi:hypothetical protein